MEIKVLCTGSPTPHPARGGTSIVIEADDNPILVDCGPETISNSLEYNVRLEKINHLFFTHHHIDHNSDFFYFAISTWVEGRDELKVYGPKGTEELLAAFQDIYAEDFEYRQSALGNSLEGVTDIDYEQTTPDLSVKTDSWSAEALPVEHAIETFAYRFSEHSTGTSVVFTGDTRKLDSVAEFASGADILIHDCDDAPMIDNPNDEVWDRYKQKYPFSEDLKSVLRTGHSNPTEAGEVAAAADVETLVLTHIRPYRDTSKMKEQAESVFDGTVIIAEDGLTITP
ncbi:MBL fold metallo-hydrolase [Halobellus captivus]|uniref:MBL fold metallo-hydrolase n=1 Tax=Halobellus captivus TaxID=2592614 RepID=UPI0011AB1A80|nr:MBL fold metallo-hydrolase [Halobellus captivus]